MKNGDALYLQISQKLLNDIKAGIYEDKRLPTEKELMEEFFVSRITARKALNKLAEIGAVVRISGRGTFVKEGNATFSGTALQRDSKWTIALIMGGYAPNFGLDILNAAVRYAEKENVHLVVKDTDNNQAAEARIVEDLRRTGVDGIIIQPAHGEIYSQGLINAVFDHYPIVMVDRSMPGIDVPFVGVDNERISEVAAEHLIEQGHQNIALIAIADEASSTIRERAAGFSAALAKHHLPVCKEYWLTRLRDEVERRGVGQCDEAVYAEYVRIIADHLKRNPQITAVFGTEYTVSRATWEAAMQIGLNVPEDLSIVSFDAELSLHGQCYLAHVRQPQAEIGRTAVRMLCALLKGEKLAQKKYLLDGEWVEGSSIGLPHNR